MMKRFTKGNCKVKNPCTICQQSVNNKNGLQCQGACKNWAHFTCLNYTPGKIQDIKTGILQILCPCPDCKTAEPKELLTSPPYSCPEDKCPAKQIPECLSSECPLNKQNQSPIQELSFDSCLEEYSYENSEESNESIRSCCQPCPSLELSKNKSKSCSPSSPTNSARGSKHPKPSATPTLKSTGKRISPKSNDEKGFTQKKSLSCSCLTKDSQTKMKVQSASSYSHIPSQDPKVLYEALEDMCNTVGQLSIQLKELMCKMIETIQSTNNK